MGCSVANEAIGTGTLAFMATMVDRIVTGLGSGASVSITYTQSTAKTVSATSDSISDTTSAASLTATQFGPFSKRTKEGYEAGQVVFRVTAADLATESITEPARTDRITVGSLVYEVADWRSDPIKSYYDILCNKVGAPR